MQLIIKLTGMSATLHFYGLYMSLKTKIAGRQKYRRICCENEIVFFLFFSVNLWILVLKWIRHLSPWSLNRCSDNRQFSVTRLVIAPDLLKCVSTPLSGSHCWRITPKLHVVDLYSYEGCFFLIRGSNMQYIYCPRNIGVVGPNLSIL